MCTKSFAFKLASYAGEGGEKAAMSFEKCRGSFKQAGKRVRIAVSGRFVVPSVSRPTRKRNAGRVGDQREAPRKLQRVEYAEFARCGGRRFPHLDRASGA